MIVIGGACLRVILDRRLPFYFLRCTVLHQSALPLALNREEGLTFKMYNNIEKKKETRLFTVNLDIDWMCRQKNWRVERRHWHHSIGIDSRFQKTPMFTPQKTNR
jgi:hypothetical protein